MFVRSIPGSAKDFSELYLCERQFVRLGKHMLDFISHRFECGIEQMVDRIQVRPEQAFGRDPCRIWTVRHSKYSFAFGQSVFNVFVCIQTVVYSTSSSAFGQSGIQFVCIQTVRNSTSSSAFAQSGIQRIHMHLDCQVFNVYIYAFGGSCIQRIHMHSDGCVFKPYTSLCAYELLLFMRPLRHGSHVFEFTASLRALIKIGRVAVFVQDR